MKSLRNLTLAATLALIGLAGGYAGDAAADTANLAGQQARQEAVMSSLLLPAVQRPRVEGDGAAELAVGAQGRKAGDANGLIGLLRPGDQAGITDGTLPAVQFPTDQKGGDGRADLVTGAGGATTGLAKVGTGTLTLVSANTYGSLRGLGSAQDLFANSRGGDQAAGAHGAGGGGGAGKVVFQDLHTTTKAGDGSVVPTDQLTGKGEAKPTALLLPAVQAAREAARRASSSNAGPASTGGAAAGGGQIAGGAAKGVNVQNTARK